MEDRCSARAHCCARCCAAGLGFAAAHPPHAETLNQALASAYQYSPRLDAERARLRATDEDVARAMSGYRPVINAEADINSVTTRTRPPSLNDGTNQTRRAISFDLVQPIFSGGQTYFAVSESEARVHAAQEALRDIEQQVLLEVVTAYMDVIRDQAIVRARENNVTCPFEGTEGHAGPFCGWRGDENGRGAGPSPPRGVRLAARSCSGQSQDQPRQLRAVGRASAERIWSNLLAMRREFRVHSMQRSAPVRKATRA